MTREQEFIKELLNYCSKIESDCMRKNLSFARKVTTYDGRKTTEFTEIVNSICKKYSDVYEKLLIDYNNDTVSGDFMIDDNSNTCVTYSNTVKSNNIEFG